MPTTSELSATEKLLEKIRIEQGHAMPDSGIASDPGFSVIPQKVALGGDRVIGISFSPEGIHLVEAIRERRQLRFSRHTCIPIDIPPDLKDPAFQSLLQSALSSFIGKRRRVHLWALMGAVDVEVRYVTIADADERQIPVLVYGALKKGPEALPKNLVYDYAVVGRRIEEGKTKLEVISCYSDQDRIQAFHRVFDRAGFPLKGVTIASFAFENLIREHRIGDEVKTLCTLYIGRGWSRIDLFDNRHIVLSRDIKTGFNSLVEAVHEEMSEVVTSRTGLPVVVSQDLAILVANLVVEGKPAQWHLNNETFSITDDRLREIARPVLVRLVRQVERTLEYFSMHYGKDPVEGIYLSGGMVRSPQVARALTQQFTVPVLAADPFHSLDFDLLHPVPTDIFERDSMVPAAGLALSSHRTLNLLHTWKERRQEKTDRKVSLVVVSVCIAILLGLFATTSVFERHLAEKESRIKTLQSSLATFSPVLLPDQMLGFYASAATARKNRVTLAKRYLSIGVMGDVISRTPDAISLVRLSMVQEEGEAKPRLEMEGIARSNSAGSAETVLAGYALRLSNSPLFSGTRVRKREPARIGEDPVVRFVAEIDFTRELAP